MLVGQVSYLNNSSNLYQFKLKSRQNFKGAKDEVISEGFKEVFTEAVLPTYKAIRGLNKLGNGDTQRCDQTRRWICR